jgi:hypothetical protein
MDAAVLHGLDGVGNPRPQYFLILYIGTLSFSMEGLELSPAAMIRAAGFFLRSADEVGGPVNRRGWDI